MDRELAVVLGMSISYVASLAGMFIAVWAYRRNTRQRLKVPPGGGNDSASGDEAPATGEEGDLP